MSLEFFDCRTWGVPRNRPQQGPYRYGTQLSIAIRLLKGFLTYFCTFILWFSKNSWILVLSSMFIFLQLCQESTWLSSEWKGRNITIWQFSPLICNVSHFIQLFWLFRYKPRYVREVWFMTFFQLVKCGNILHMYGGGGAHLAMMWLLTL